MSSSPATAPVGATVLEPLVRAASAGDADAYGRLVAATSGLVSSIALAIVRDLELSQDIAQDVFLSAWRDLRKLRNPTSFLPWLRQMTRNRAHHVLRDRVRGRRHVDGVDSEALERALDPGPDVADRLLAAERQAALDEALAALPDDTREVLTLFYREGQSAAQVASLLELSEYAVKKRLSRARMALRGVLLDRLGDTLGATTPGAAFVAAVMSALPMATPLVASALTATASKSLASGSAGGGALLTLAKLLPLAGGALAGAAGGVAGVAFGVQKLIRDARDTAERRALRRFQVTAVTVVIVFSFGFQLCALYTDSPWAPVANFAAFIIALGALYRWWLPRITRARFAQEMREDPVRASARRARERRSERLGWTLGLTFGTLALLLGIWLKS
jgi:RNA polymerase sigma factor (sigma-70 family)